MPVIDFHSHVLPGIDDGSRNVEESLEMLRISASQGVDYIAATSHFYPVRDRISSYLKRRQDAYERLMKGVSKECSDGGKFPRILVGAEVAFFSGISHWEYLEELTYEGTNLMLLEMPYDVWNDSDIKEVADMIKHRNVRIILAHLERFLSVPENKRQIRKLLELPVYVQINAGSLDSSWTKRRQIFKIIKEKGMIFLGSDAHGIHHRVPNLLAGREILEKKMGIEYMKEMDEKAARLLGLEGK